MRTIKWPLVALAIVAICAAGFAQSAAPQTNAPHSPYTIPGMLVRIDARAPVQGLWGPLLADMGPALFQETAPCLVYSTLAGDNYPAPWGGSPFAANEGRTIPVRGVLRLGDFVNPCSELIPDNAIAAVTRVRAYNVGGDGAVYVSNGKVGVMATRPSLKLHTADMLMEEAGTMIHPDYGSIYVEVANTPADIAVEVLGYFLRDASFDPGVCTCPPYTRIDVN